MNEPTYSTMKDVPCDVFVAALRKEAIARRGVYSPSSKVAQLLDECARRIEEMVQHLDYLQGVIDAKNPFDIWVARP